MYEDISQDYDRFVNWENRLRGEMPFLERQLAGLGTAGGPRVLDAACGTGMHAIAVKQSGAAGDVAGADISRGMIEKARQNAAAAGAEVRFETAGFGGLAQTFGAHSFDALLCLGNSLPHAVEASSLLSTLRDFAQVLAPGGRLVLQNRNFDAVMAQRSRWMEPQAHREGEREWVFLRFYDFDPDGLISFHMATLRRTGPEDAWQQQVTTTRLRPLLADDLLQALAQAGFQDIKLYGSLAGDTFLPESSGNLVVTAVRK